MLLTSKARALLTAVDEFLWAHENDPDLRSDIHYIFLRDCLAEFLAEDDKGDVTCGWCKKINTTYEHVKACRTGRMSSQSDDWYLETAQIDKAKTALANLIESLERTDSS